MKNSILVLSYFFNQDGLACSHHIDDKLVALIRSGYTPVVLSATSSPQSTQCQHYRIPPCSIAGIRFELREILRKKAAKHLHWKILRELFLVVIAPLYAVERFFLKLNPIWYWYPSALLVGGWLCYRKRIRVIYSTGGPAVAHQAAKKLAKWFPCKWLAEVQDPLVHEYCAENSREYDKLVQLEKAVYLSADKMIFLTQQAMLSTEERVGRSGRGLVIHPGALSFDTTPWKKHPEVLRLAHFGSLSNVRNLKYLITGLETMLAENEKLKKGFSIHLYGDVGKDDLARIKSSPCQSMFTLEGKVDRGESIKAMQAYDILLLIQGVHDISRETIPSKIYEYFISQRLVLGLVHDNPELKEMIHTLGHIAVPADDSSAIGQALLLLHSDMEERVSGIKSSPYKTEHAVQKLLTVSGCDIPPGEMQDVSPCELSNQCKS